MFVQFYYISLSDGEPVIALTSSSQTNRMCLITIVHKLSSLCTDLRVLEILLILVVMPAAFCSVELFISDLQCRRLVGGEHFCYPQHIGNTIIFDCDIVQK